MLQQTTTNGTTTTTASVADQTGANLEDVTTSGSGTTTTTAYYYLGGKRIALAVNHTASYLASDLLGSAEVALNTTGTATASLLYDAYGQVRYTNGTMPGSYGYTGQHDDTATTGLDYYGARYYDPAIGQFASADSLGSGYNRYAYVAGNPESRTDPTGHLITCGTSCAGGGTTPSPTPPPNPPPPNPSQPTPPRPQGSPVQPAAHHTTPLDLTNPNVAGGGGPKEPPGVQRAQQDALAARQTFESMAGQLQAVLDALHHVESDNPFWVNLILTNGIDAGLSLSVDELHVLGSLYRQQADWSVAEWSVGHVLLYSGVIDAALAVLTSAVVTVGLEWNTLADALIAASGPLAPIAVGFALTSDWNVDSWAAITAGVSLYAGYTVGNTAVMEVQALTS